MAVATRPVHRPDASATAARRRRRRWSDLLTGYAFVTPNLLLLVLFLFIPLGWAFVLSFQDVGSFGPATWIGLDNYRTFFQEQALITGLRNTLIYAVITSGMKVVLAPSGA